MAINCLELHELFNPYNLENVWHVFPGMYCLCMFVKYSNISMYIKLSHFNCTRCTVCAVLEERRE